MSESEQMNNIQQESSELFKHLENNGHQHIEKVEYAQTAKDIVEHIISASELNNNNMVDVYANEAHQRIDKMLSKSLENLQSSETPDITWLTIGEFDIEKGKKKIEEYIKTWEIGNSWLYCIDFLCEDIMAYSKRYRYKVQWSIPTRRKPIPRATASVYFTVDVSTVKPAHLPSNVYYIFETSKLVHVPGKSRFREKWLKDIVESKVLLMEAGLIKERIRWEKGFANDTTVINSPDEYTEELFWRMSDTLIKTIISCLMVKVVS